MNCVKYVRPNAHTKSFENGRPHGDESRYRPRDEVVPERLYGDSSRYYPFSSISCNLSVRESCTNREIIITRCQKHIR